LRFRSAAQVGDVSSGAEIAMADKKKFKQLVRERMVRTGESYMTAKRALELGVEPGAPGLHDRATDGRDPRRAYRKASLGAWKKLTERLSSGAARVEWTVADDIIRVLNEIGEDAPENHAHMPILGGLDFTGAKPSHEKGCIEMRFHDSIRLVRPAHLSLTVTKDDPLREWAFFWLQTAPLERTGVDLSASNDREELTEIAPGIYRERWCWDENSLGYDEDDYEIPLPREARLVVRILRGAFLIVPKAGGYNSSDIYDGRHDRMGETRFRAEIQTFVDDLNRRELYGRDLWG
jgi:hypothetical protein